MTSNQYVQLAQGVQTDTSTASSIYINKTGTSGNLLQLQSSGVDVLDLGNSGTMTLHTTGSDSTTALLVQSHTSGSVFDVDTSNWRVGIGTNSPNEPLEVDDNAPSGSDNAIVKVDGSLVDPSNYQSAIYATPTVAPTSASSQEYIGVKSSPNSSSSNLASGSMTALYGGVYYNPGTAQTLQNAYGLHVQLFTGSSTATITNTYDAWLQNPSKAASSTITNDFGLYIEDQTKGGTTNSDLNIGGTPASGNYAIYDASTYQNYFAGNVGIGGAAGTNALTVTGSGSFSTSVLTPTLDTASSVALSIGNTNASSISLGNTTSNIQTTISGTTLVKPTNGHDSATAFQVQNGAGTSTIFDVDTSHSRIGVGTGGPNYPVEVSSSVASGSDQTAIKYDGSINDASNSQSGIYSAPNVAPSAASTQEYIGLKSLPGSSSANVSGASITALYGGDKFNPGSAATLGSAYGLHVQLSTANANATITNVYGAWLQNPSKAASSTITNDYGAYIENQTQGGSINSDLNIGGLPVSGNYAIYDNSSYQNYLAGATTVANNLIVSNNGYLATQRGTDYSTTGTSNNVNFGAASLIRLTGASAQTITGIANGADGRMLTLINAGSATDTISNLNAGSSAANQIATGTGGDVTIPVGGSLSFVYDGGASLWRVIAIASAVGGYVQLQGVTPGTQQTGYFNISGTGIDGTAFQAPSFDTASAGTLAIGTTNATAINLNQNTSLASGKSLTINNSYYYDNNLTGEQLVLNENGTYWGAFYGDGTNNRTYFGASSALGSAPASPIMTWDLGASSVGINVTAPGTNQLSIATSAAGNTGLNIAGTSGQTGNMVQVQDNTGANLHVVDAGGDLEQLGYLDTPYGGYGTYGNLLKYSEQFDNATWTKTNVTAPTANTVVSPDGNTTAESLADSASGGSVTQTSSTAPTNNNYTFSVWLKTSSGTQAFALRIDGATTGTGTAYTGAATTTWQRFSVTQNTNGFTGNIKVDIFPGGAGGTGTVSAWGAQLIKASTASIYVRSVGSAVAASDGLVSNGTAIFQPAADATNAFQFASSAGNDVLEVDTTNGRAGINTSGTGNIFSVHATYGDASSSGIGQDMVLLQDNFTGSPTVRVLEGIDSNLPTTDQIVADMGVDIGTSGDAAYYGLHYINSGSVNNAMTFGLYGKDNLMNLYGDASGHGFLAINNPGTVGTAPSYNLDVSGTARINSSSGNATAFLVQNAGTTTLLTADTSAMQVVIGNSGNTITLSPSAGFTAAGTAQHTKTILLTPEFANAVLDAAADATCSSANNGTMTAGLATSTGLGNGYMNFYKWTTSAGTNQCYDVVVQVPIPSDFSSWASNPLSVSAYTSNTTNGTINLEARDSSGTQICNYVNVTPGSTSTWAANNSACTLSSGTYTAGSYMTLRIRLTAPSGGITELGNISLSYKSSF